VISDNRRLIFTHRLHRNVSGEEGSSEETPRFQSLWSNRNSVDIYRAPLIKKPIVCLSEVCPQAIDIFRFEGFSEMRHFGPALCRVRYPVSRKLEGSNRRFEAMPV